MSEKFIVWQEVAAIREQLQFLRNHGAQATSSAAAHVRLGRNASAKHRNSNEASAGVHAMKLSKSYVITAVVGIFILLCLWLGGFDFTTRRPELGCLLFGYGILLRVIWIWLEQ